MRKNTGLYWAALIVISIGLLFAVVLFPTQIWLSAALSVLLLADLALLIREYRRELSGRTVAYGTNSFITAILVIALVGVLNFLAARYPFKADLTRNKLHTLSGQTEKVVKGLETDVKAVLFAKAGAREEFGTLLEGMEDMNPKFDVEYVDPDKEPTRAKTAGIKKYNTLVLHVGEKETRIEEVNEENVTNALIKMIKDKPQVFCALSGHGEADFEGKEADGYFVMKEALQDQAYEVRDVKLFETGEVPQDCTAVAVIGPDAAFFEKEIEALRKYLNEGGRALFAIGIDPTEKATTKELLPLLKEWYVEPKNAMIIDPSLRAFGVDAAVPVIPQYSTNHPITRDFKEGSFFAFARPLEIISGAPADLNVEWLAKSGPSSWGETSFAALRKGEAAHDADKDIKGPATVAIAIEGKKKDSKAKKKTRIVVFGSSEFANNQYSRFGGNDDFFLNAASWVMEDENLISIRGSEEDAGKVELSQQSGKLIALVTIVLVPLLIAIAGIVIWARRRKL